MGGSNLLIFIGANILFALLVGLFAKRKGRKVFLWVVAGLLSGIVTLIGLAFFQFMEKIPEGKKEGSVTRETAFCWIMIILGIFNLSPYKYTKRVQVYPSSDGITQLALFANPTIRSTSTKKLKAQNARGGIICNLLSIPVKPLVILKNDPYRKLREASDSNFKADHGGCFAIELNDEDNATSQLLSKLRTKKTIEEIAVYELATTNNKEQYGYYFSKIFVNKVTDKIIRGTRSIKIHCRCISFRQKDSLNNEPVLWDWDAQWARYTGILR